MEKNDESDFLRCARTPTPEFYIVNIRVGPVVLFHSLGSQVYRVQTHNTALIQNHPVKCGHSKEFDVFDDASTFCCYVLKQKHSGDKAPCLLKFYLRICGPENQLITIPANVEIVHGLMFLMMSQLLAATSQVSRAVNFY
ncbi:jg52 [Pararge aegeria aegeria]|uniref:Jg52 protein n=1 Tax=Pararge aegeria aegeria TaxID=348720 RepID=A0A8S4QJX3_9NEOP|nr:jg52 [Pararge aegeria aegeria]